MSKGKGGNVLKRQRLLEAKKKREMAPVVDRKEQQRQWAINRKFEIRDYLCELGKSTFDKPKI